MDDNDDDDMVKDSVLWLEWVNGFKSKERSWVHVSSKIVTRTIK